MEVACDGSFTGRALEDEQVSSALSQIAAITAGLALYTAGYIFLFTEINTKGFLKSLTVSVSLAVLAAVLISVARNLGA
jgi:hypothetical protein